MTTENASVQDQDAPPHTMAVAPAGAVSRTESVSDEEYEYLLEKASKIKYRAELSCLYHQKRERFFELLDKFSKAISLIGGSAALWKIADQGLVTKLAFLIAIASTLSLVFSFSDRSKKHAELGRGFKDLLSKIALKGERNALDPDVNEWESKLLLLETSEPTALSALVVICENQIKIVGGHRDLITHLRWYHRWFAHFYDFDSDMLFKKSSSSLRWWLFVLVALIVGIAI